MSERVWKCSGDHFDIDNSEACKDCPLINGECDLSFTIKEEEAVCTVYYPPVCDQLIDRGQKCYYGTHAGKECPPKGELSCVCSGDHLEIENCRDCPKYNDCDLSFTIMREETP